MTRPTIIRADTLDLRDHQQHPTPDAQLQNPSSDPNHSDSANLVPQNQKPHIGAHQAETLREIAHETAQEELRSPRLAQFGGDSDQFYHDEPELHPAEIAANKMDAYRRHEEEALTASQQAAQQAAAAHGSDSEDEHMEDGDMEDDMMDKISSSPSIEDATQPHSLAIFFNLFVEPTVDASLADMAAETEAVDDDDASDYDTNHSDSQSDDHNILEVTEIIDQIEETIEDDDATVANDPESHDPLDMDFTSDESLPDSEDIDFDFVYALHTFVATVEGQANATKGDTMVLLDDSNSYWWLVRVVKDSSIGYLPAEHIETPTERLARLNKHRNIDLSATMLGDQATKPKKAFMGMAKKRKTVVFSEPTYVDYSDFDYSTDEEDIEELLGAQDGQAQEKTATEAADGHADSGPNVEIVQNGKVDAEAVVAGDEKAATHVKKTEPTIKEVQPDSDDDIIDETVDGPSRSKNGTVRNTDSFFKDSSETKKMTLTPNLLRDDDVSSPPDASRDRQAAMDKLEKELTPDKEKRKSRDKKPSAIRNFFSRKDKKRTQDDDDESFGKRSMDIMSEPRDSDDRFDEASPEKNSRRLQKPQPRSEPSTGTRKISVGAAQKQTAELSSYLSEPRTNDVSSVPPASMRIVDPHTQETREVPSNQQNAASREISQASLEPAPLSSPSSGAMSALSKIVPRRSPSSGSDVKPQKTTKAKTRMELEISSESEAEHDTDAVVHSPPSSIDGDATTVLPTKEAAVTHHSSPSMGSNPPALVADTSSTEARTPDATPSPEPTPSKEGSTKAPTWDDSKLRSFFDDGEHVRDLLAVVYDKNDLGPVGMDHPIAGGLFREQNAKLAEITTQLDNLLGDWLSRKQRTRTRGRV